MFEFRSDSRIATEECLSFRIRLSHPSFDFQRRRRDLAVVIPTIVPEDLS
jgi:hypothetical protein